ncbi:MAG: radical SAM protein [Lachnospiraceae bacterium]|nr:radical SAM protein [Lachnospiraceae bacterium]
MTDKIKKVYIEITNVCNLSCNFCPKTKREQRFMKPEEFSHILQEVKPYTNHVYLHLMGEPLLNADIGSFLKECEANRIQVNLTTNGTLLEKRGDELLSYPALRQVNVSLHSFEANEKTVELEHYVCSVTDFVKKARDKKTIVSIRLWNMDSEDLKGANGLNHDILAMLEEELELSYSLGEKLLETHQLKLMDRVYLNMAEKFEWPDIEKDSPEDEVFCYGLRNQLGVLVDGTVVPCCLDSEGTIALGNVFKEPLADILAKDRARNLYEGFSRRRAVEELCKRCGYAKRF